MYFFFVMEIIVTQSSEVTRHNSSFNKQNLAKGMIWYRFELIIVVFTYTYIFVQTFSEMIYINWCTLSTPKLVIEILTSYVKK